MSRKYRIAWANDDSKLSDEIITEDLIRYTGGGVVADILYPGEPLKNPAVWVSIPSKWLRFEGTNLITKPGHMWWRYKGMDWSQGFLTREGVLIEKAGLRVDVSELDIEIRSAHAIPPDETVSKDDLLHRIDGRGEPTYARRWEDLSNAEMERFNVARRDIQNYSHADAYHETIRIASLPTLRNVGEFTEEEIHELIDSFHERFDYRDGIKVSAAKTIEIAKRSTS